MYGGLPALQRVCHALLGAHVPPLVPCLFHALLAHTVLHKLLCVPIVWPENLPLLLGSLCAQRVLQVLIHLLV
jgi:hypothetical protein